MAKLFKLFSFIPFIYITTCLLNVYYLLYLLIVYKIWENENLHKRTI